MADRVVLAYSGGLDSSVAIGRLRDATGGEIVALTLDVGQRGEDMQAIRQRALDHGAVESVVIDAKDEFADDHVVPALKANARYQRRSPLVSALSRPLIAKHLAVTAKQLGAVSVAHGGAQTGDDRVRFEAAVAAIAPDLSFVAVAETAADTTTGTTFDTTTDTTTGTATGPTTGTDQNLWGRVVRTGLLDDPWTVPAADCYADTQDPTLARDPDEVTITFERGVPVAIDGQRFSVLRVVQELNALAGRHGVGRIDVVEDRLVGIKARQICEAPAAATLIAAHEELENLTLERDVIRYKRGVEADWADLVHDGLWFGGLKRTLDAFVDSTQQHVSGDVRVRLHGGSATVTGRRSDQSLYDFELATSGAAGSVDAPPPGFSDIWSIPGRIAARRDRAN